MLALAAQPARRLPSRLRAQQQEPVAAVAVAARGASRGPGSGAAASLLRRMAPSEGRRATSAGARVGGMGSGSARTEPPRSGPAGAPRFRRGTPGRGKAGAPDCGALQDADPLRQRLHARIEVGPHGTHGGDLEDDLRVGRLPHVDQRVTEDLHAAHHAGQAHRLGHGAEPLERRPGHRAQLGRQRGEEDLTQVVDQLGGRAAAVPTLRPATRSAPPAPG